MEPSAPPADPAPATVSSDGPQILQAMLAETQARPSLGQPLRAGTALLQGDTLVLVLLPDFVPFAQMHTEEYLRIARQVAKPRLKL